MLSRRRKQRDGLSRPSRLITVFSSPRDRSRGVLRCGPLVLQCALGRAGVTHLKREGDGATPAGRMRLLALLRRPDRGPPPQSAVPARAMRRDDAWCEDPESGCYNRLVRLPRGAGHDAMWRDDHLYDITGILDWNMVSRASRRGSAIFLHLARPGLAPTAGCIALSARDLRLLLSVCGPSPTIVVDGPPRKVRRGRNPRR
jgi:L,D-peptidoglycan transpeptidase YkuD (ErfK/YbiS/YcfS/YnhG family)